MDIISIGFSNNSDHFPLLLSRPFDCHYQIQFYSIHQYMNAYEFIGFMYKNCLRLHNWLVILSYKDMKQLNTRMGIFLVRGLAYCLLNVWDCCVEGAFSLYDIDKDGKITREEMVRIVTAIFEMVGNSQSAGESPEQRVDKIFSLMDKVRLVY